MEHLDPPLLTNQGWQNPWLFRGDEGFLQAGDFHRSLGPPWDKGSVRDRSLFIAGGGGFGAKRGEI